MRRCAGARYAHAISLVDQETRVSSNRFILTLRCPDARGIIHAISGALLELEGNVFEQAQYTN
ncbi:MAG: hypothetical protein CMH40_09060, partial [Micrococcales bacterium]|nr:hypothetical protein [Micrococcales bacterium]